MDHDLEFWKLCADAGCVVLPVMLYKNWGEDGNLDPSQKIGLHFTAVPFDADAVISDGAFCMVDESVTGLENYHPTPVEALEAYLHSMETKG